MWPEAIEDAKVNSALNGIDNTLFYAGDMKDILTNDFIAEHGRPDVIITDLPAQVCTMDVIDVILAAEPKRIVYVSCNPATQARDLQLLDGKYKGDCRTACRHVPSHASRGKCRGNWKDAKHSPLSSNF